MCRARYGVAANRLCLLLRLEGRRSLTTAEALSPDTSMAYIYDQRAAGGRVRAGGTYVVCNVCFAPTNPSLALISTVERQKTSIFATSRMEAKCKWVLRLLYFGREIQPSWGCPLFFFCPALRPALSEAFGEIQSGKRWCDSFACSIFDGGITPTKAEPSQPRCT